MTLSTSRRGVIAGAGAMAAALGGCANGRIVGLDKERRSLDIANSSEPLSVDPHKCSTTAENNIIGNMFVGLTTEDAHANVVAGMAERWETSEDGLTWTFFLRRANWSDGEPVNAHDFQFALRRILDPATTSTYASILYPIKNAEQVNSARLPKEELGVTALDDMTLEIRLENPSAFLPALLKHYTAFPVPKHKVLEFGDAWVKPENIVVNGAYILRRWWSNYIIHLERNPQFWDHENVELESLYFYPSNDVNAAARRVMSRECGWSTRFPSNQVEELRRALPGYVRVAPFLTCEYFSINCRRAPFDDVRVRRALTMAYDRDFVANSIYGTGERAAYAFIPPGIANYPGGPRYRWADLPLPERRREAERLLRDAGFGPNNPLRFEFSHRNSGDNPRVAVVAQSSWRAIAPWVAVELRGVETQVHYDNLANRNYDIGDGAWAADYNDAKNYLFVLETRTGPQNYCDYSNPEFDALVLQSDSEQDIARRAQLMMRAEQIALDDAAICTSVFLNSTNLVHPELAGYEDNLEDIHRARFFRIARA